MKPSSPGKKFISQRQRLVLVVWGDHSSGNDAAFDYLFAVLMNVYNALGAKVPEDWGAIKPSGLG